jgi:hypothetical protein
VEAATVAAAAAATPFFRNYKTDIKISQFLHFHNIYNIEIP